MKTVRLLISGLFVFMFLTPVVGSADQILTPKATIEKTVDEIISVVQKYDGDSHTKERREKLREAINPRFDFATMARLSLGASWNEIKENEQKEFVAVFSDLLAKTYLAKIETVKPGMVSFENETIDATGKKSVVKTLVKSKGDVFPIDYKLLISESGWKVYDVVIENIGLVVNYRNEFASVIRKDKFEGLMKKLQEKLG